jgi:MYXO-CTERM domain-containing protein
MSGLDWNVAAVSASASAIAALIAVAVGLRRRRRSQTTGGADPLPERRIEVVAIDEDVEQEPNA